MTKAPSAGNVSAKKRYCTVPDRTPIVAGINLVFLNYCFLSANFTITETRMSVPQFAEDR